MGFRGQGFRGHQGSGDTIQGSGDTIHNYAPELSMVSPEPN
jgi:hypothetical protein